MRKRFQNRWIAILLLALAAPALVLAQDIDEEAEEEDQAATAVEDEALELRGQTVTGSRLVGGDPSARVYSLSAEDIATRGVSNLEELFRTLPWAYSSLTSQTNGSFTFAAADTDVSLGALGLGTSTVNLRALGSANTLVLLNGRRIAGAAGREDDFANLLNIPLSAIERVDIQLDGASAVYGADAIGGVVNFITKKDYRGFAATLRQELSATDADRRNISLLGGYAWLSGNITATASQDRSEPINNRKIWTSSDFRDLYGPEFDNRSTSITQPGTVCDWNYGSTQYGANCAFRAPKLQLPTTHNGVGATEADFTTDITPADYVAPQNGEDSTVTSFSVRIEQYLTDSLRVYADVLISDAESYQEFPTRLINYLIPASNAYNPFGRHVVVNYYPIHEIENGIIPSSYTDSENKQRNYNAGILWEFGDGHQFQFNLTRSESERAAKQVRTDWRRSRFDPGQEAFYAALASSDPNVALNLFGDGTVQGSAFAELFTNAVGPSLGFTEVTSYDALVRGEVFEIWGGRVSYALGAEYRETAIWSHSLGYGEGGTQEARLGREDFIGVNKPTRDSNAYFAEFALPLVGDRNARPGLQSLVLSLQARRDTHKAIGALGGESREFRFDLTSTYWDYRPDEGWVERTRSGQNVYSGDPELGEITRSATSPRVGLQYKPVESFTVRSAWSRSFTPPVFSDLFDVGDPSSRTQMYVDPYHPEGVTDQIPIPYFFGGPSPEIKNEYSDNFSLGFDWNSESIPGLAWTVDWVRVDFTNKIDSAFALLTNYPEIAFNLPGIVKRDENGYAAQIIANQVNVAEKINETLDTSIQYTFNTSLGVFTPRLSYHRVLNEFYRISPETEPQARVGTALGSDRYKLTGYLSWTFGRIAADLFVRYTPSYTNDRTGMCPYGRVVGRCDDPFDFRATKPSIEMDPMTTVDLTVTYSMDNGLRIRAGGRNIFDADNPTVWERLPYDPTRWDARGRVLYLELKYER